jgi:hypothetical protein
MTGHDFLLLAAGLRPYHGSASIQLRLGLRASVSYAEAQLAFSSIIGFEEFPAIKLELRMIMKGDLLLKHCQCDYFYFGCGERTHTWTCVELSRLSVRSIYLNEVTQFGYTISGAIHSCNAKPSICVESRELSRPILGDASGAFRQTQLWSDHIKHGQYTL